MADTQLTTLGTVAWLILAVSPIILLARRGTGSSWGISTAIARGLIGWTGRNGIIAGEWSSDDELPPTDLTPDAATKQSRRTPGACEDAMAAELEELGSRHLG